MTKAYLGVWTTPEEDIWIEITTQPSEIVQRPYGRASPLFGWDGGNEHPVLGKSGAILFLVSRSPSAMLASLTNDLLPNSGGSASAFVTHGHATTLIFTSNVAAAETFLEALSPLVSGYELWPYEDGRLVLDEYQCQVPSMPEGWPQLSAILDADMNFEAQAQVIQFNSNIALLSRLASAYASELWPLVEWLHGSVGEIVKDLVGLALRDDDEAVRKSLQLESVLVEANAVLTLYCSQVGSGILPLLSSSFPVGEYSLLGIGTMSRAAWRIYAHLNATFAEHDHVGLLRRHYHLAQGFNPFAASGRVDYSEWHALNANIEDLKDGQPGEFRYHVPYFSSRWGFHEALHSISLSWQCLYASATKEWNLLTATHEFLHAHVRDLFAIVMKPESEEMARDIADAFNRRDQGSNALQSMRIAYVEALVGLQNATRLAQRVSGKKQELKSSSPQQMDTRFLDYLNREYSELFHEIVVHVLDFRYVYDGRDEVYINSIWSSWSLVPSVGNRIEHYVLRTLCALAATSRRTIPSELFEEVCERLMTVLGTISDRERARPTIRRAMDLLSTDVSRTRLSIQMSAAMYVVELTKNFFFDSRLNAALVRDDLTMVENGRRTYKLEAGQFLGDEISSPVGFLLDRFPGYADQAGSDGVEYESIWQMLQLV